MSIKGWILSRRHKKEITKDRDYEIFRHLEEAPHYGAEIEIVHSSQVDICVASECIVLNGDRVGLPDFVLTNTGDGTSYYDLAVMRHLMQSKVPVINSPYAIESVKDKLHTQQILSSNNLPIPKTMLVKSPLSINVITKNFDFPVVVKTLHGSLGTGVLLIETQEKLADFCEFIETLQPNSNIIIQEFIGCRTEIADLRVFVVGSKVVGCMKRISQDGSFKTNISRGSLGENYLITSEIEWLATETTKALQLDISGVDLLFSDGSFKICEANAAPQFKGLEKCCKVNVAKNIWEYLLIKISG